MCGWLFGFGFGLILGGAGGCLDLVLSCVWVGVGGALGFWVIGGLLQVCWLFGFLFLSRIDIIHVSGGALFWCVCVL